MKHRFFRLTTLFFICFINDSFAQMALTGTVVDAKTGERIKGVSVSLTKNIPFQTGGSPYYGELITLSNEGGHFAFGTQVGNIDPHVTMPVSKPYVAPVIKKNAVHLFVGKPTLVRIDIFSVIGKRLQNVLDKKLDRGNYAIKLFSTLSADQVYIIKVHLGDDICTFKHIPFVNTYIHLKGAQQPLLNAASSHIQYSAVVDTVFIIANGYWSKRVFIESYEGELGHIKLDPIELECEGCGKEPPHIGSYKEYFIDVNGEQRRYGLSVPSGYDKDKKVALFLALHGMGAMAQEDWESIWKESLEPPIGDNAVFVYPEARRGGGIYDLVWQVHAHRGNYEFFDELVKYILKNLCITETDIYLIGFSFGGKMANGVRCLRGGSLFSTVIPASDVNGQAFNCPHHFDCTLCDCESAQVPVFISAAKENVGGGVEYNHAFYNLDTLLNYYDCPDEYETISKESWGGDLFEYRLYNKGNCAQTPVIVSINDANHWFEPPQGVALWEFVTTMISERLTAEK